MPDAILTSAAIVALAEIGDKTMLLALVLAARLRRPGAILAGILVATLANHALAALLGQQITGLLDSTYFRAAVALGFIVMGLWVLVPDKLSDDELQFKNRRNAFLTTLIAFFMVEMGDKTQIATIALGAQYRDVLAVTIGTTLGMMLANAPAVLLGDRLLRRVSLNVTRALAALLFVALGLWGLARLF